jgi:F420-dependent methylenetetrahydromethanopterin dehydrogenase
MRLLNTCKQYRGQNTPETWVWHWSTAAVAVAAAAAGSHQTLLAALEVVEGVAWVEVVYCLCLEDLHDAVSCVVAGHALIGRLLGLQACC